FTPADFADSSGNPLLVNSQPCPGGATCGLNWADALTSRLGYTVVNNEPYSTPACNTTDYTSPTGCVFPNGVIPSSAFSTPAIKILPYIPLGDGNGKSARWDYAIGKNTAGGAGIIGSVAGNGV